MKWEEDADPEDADEDDNAEFDKMRKVGENLSNASSVATLTRLVQELRTFLDSILAIDQVLVTDAVRTLALDTITAFKNGVSIKWNDAELGVYLVFIFGEINKSM